MRKLIFNSITLLLFIYLASCSRYDIDETRDFYKLNKSILDLIVDEIYNNQLYTYIYVSSSSSNSHQILLQTIDSTYKIVHSTKSITNNNFNPLINEYNDKTKKLNSTNIENLKKILKWMLDNSITAISLKTPERDHLTIKLSDLTGLCYQTKKDILGDFSKFEEIDTNWYYVTFK